MMVVNVDDTDAGTISAADHIIIFYAAG